MDDEGATIGDKQHELCVYKCDDRHKLLVRARRGRNDDCLALEMWVFKVAVYYVVESGWMIELNCGMYV